MPDRLLKRAVMVSGVHSRHVGIPIHLLMGIISLELAILRELRRVMLKLIGILSVVSVKLSKEDVNIVTFKISILLLIMS